MKLPRPDHAWTSALAAMALALAALALVARPAPAASLPVGSTALLSGAPSLFEALPAPSGRSDTSSRAVSSDGRYVAFASTSDGLVDGDDDRVMNIYRKDMAGGGVTLVSRRDGAAGEPSHGTCFDPAISDDGNRVAFVCDRSLEPGVDENGFYDVYVRDVTTGATLLASRKSGLGPVGNDHSYGPSLSADGSFVAFDSYAASLVSGTPTPGVFRRHLGGANETILVSRGPNQGPASGRSASISDNGNRIAFTTTGALESDDQNNAIDVYVRDVNAAVSILASRADKVAGAPSNGQSYDAAISGDGLAVAFTSTATNLETASDPTNEPNVYRRSIPTSETTLVDTTSAGKRSGSGYHPSIDTSGAVVAFVSVTTALDPADTDPVPDVYVKHLVSNEVRLASRADGATGAAANAYAESAAISGDGTKVAVELLLGSVAPGGDPRNRSVVLRDLTAQTTRSVARPPGDGPFLSEGGDSEQAALSADGRYAAFESKAGGLGLPVRAFEGVVVRDRVTGDVTLVSRTDGPDGAAFAEAHDASISADGRRVAFSGRVKSEGHDHVWVRDLAAGTTVLADRADGGEGTIGDGPAQYPKLDADGSRVAFVSQAGNLGDGDTDTVDDVFVRDLDTRDTILVSRADGAAGAKGDDYAVNADIDASGTRVSFASYASNLGDGDADRKVDIHVRDLTTGTTLLASAVPGGPKGDRDSGGRHSIDAAGNRIAFFTRATNLGDPAPGEKVFVRDLAAGTLTPLGSGGNPVISPDGGVVGLDRHEPDGLNEVLRHDLATGQREIVSRRDGADGAPAARDAAVSDISAGGACVAFDTDDGLIGPQRDPREVYLRAFAADCGDVAPVEPGPGDGPVVSGGPVGTPRDLLAPVLSRVRLSRKRFRAARGSRLTFRSSEAATLTVTVQRLRPRRGARRVAVVRRRIAAGAGRVRLRTRVGRHALRRGGYRLTLTARDAAGNRSRPVRLSFRVLARKA